jgi:hypothetical protein
MSYCYSLEAPHHFFLEFQQFLAAFLVLFLPNPSVASVNVKERNLRVQVVGQLLFSERFGSTILVTAGNVDASQIFFHVFIETPATDEVTILSTIAGKPAVASSSTVEALGFLVGRIVQTHMTVTRVTNGILDYLLLTRGAWNLALLLQTQ